MADKKMTYVTCVTNLMNGIVDEETKARAIDLIASLQKKGSAKPKVNPNAEPTKKAILEVLEGTDGMTISEMIATSPDLVGKSTQAVSPYAKALVEEGLVTKFSDKRKTYFKLV